MSDENYGEMRPGQGQFDLIREVKVAYPIYESEPAKWALQSFSEEPICRMCGGECFTKFHSGVTNNQSICFDHYQDEGGQEFEEKAGVYPAHLHRTCRRCNYEWVEHTQEGSRR